MSSWFSASYLQVVVQTMQEVQLLLSMYNPEGIYKVGEVYNRSHGTIGSAVHHPAFFAGYHQDDAQADDPESPGK